MATPTEEELQVNAEILQALTEGGEGTVRHGAPPQLREIVTRGDEDFPAPVVAKVFEDAGVKRIYDTRTGEPSLTSINMLPAQLKKLRPDGSGRLFTYVKPEKEPVRGQFKCLLHPDQREPDYDKWGFPACRKDNITSPMQVEQHMEHRHRVEWAAIKAERERRQKEREFEIQQRIAEAAVARK